MRKFTALIIGSMVLVTAGSANAIVVDPAAAGLCQGPLSAPTGDKFVPNASPHCVCKPGQGDQERVNLQVPGTAALVKAVAQYGDFRDRCATVSEIKRAPKLDKKEKPVETPKATKAPAPVPPPVCEASDITATGNDASNKVFCTGPGVSKINRVVTTCDTCRPAIEDKTIVGPKTGALIYQVDVSKAQFPGPSSLVTVRFFTKDSKDVQAKYTIVWPAPVAPPPPVVVSPLSKCLETGGQILGNDCVCIGDFIKVPGKLMCEPKPVPPPVKVVEDKGTIVHPIIGGLCGYSSSKSFKSGDCYASLGLALDIKDYLWWQGNLWLGGPGATRVYSDGTPVVLANGNIDKRSLSLAYGMGFLAHFDWFGANVGILREGHGLTGGITSPTDVATSGVIGAKLLLPFDGGTFVFGPNFTVGTNEMGSKAADVMWGLNLQAEVLIFNPHRPVKK